MSKKSTDPGTEKESTPEELKLMRSNLSKYYKEQNEVLVLQSEFEKHQADIAENRARTLFNQMRFAQMMQGPKDPAHVGDGTRKLKTDT